MKTQWFKVTLESDLVVSARWVTAGGHEGLDFLPGRVFLGAVASVLAQRKSFDPALLLSGSLRFRPAYPWIEGPGMTLPIPLCWHEIKNEPAAGVFNGVLKTPRDWDQLARCNPPRQPVQIRHGYATPAQPRTIARVRMTQRMKTAIATERLARAADGQLFGYASIRAGSRFLGSVQADGAVQCWDKIIEILTSGTIRLGRSRTAEYGKTRIELADPPQLPAPRPPQGSVSLYLASDTALVRHGIPTLQPDPSMLGLPGWTIDWHRSFLRHRSYAPWNEFHKSHELERTVLCKGGVITLIAPSSGASVQGETTSDAFARGIGAYRNEGLGWTMINPDFLFADGGNELPEITVPQARAATATVRAGSTTTPLLGLLARRRADVLAEYQATEVAKVWHARLCRELRNNVERKPSASQWRSLQAVVRAHRGDTGALIATLEEHFSPAFRRKVWGDCGHGLHHILRGLIEESRQNPRLACRAFDDVAGKLAREVAAKKEK